MGGVYTLALAATAWGRVKTVFASAVIFRFLTANEGVIVTGVAPLIMVGVIMGFDAFFPRVLRLGFDPAMPGIH